MSINKVIIGSGNGLLSIQHQAITWTNEGVLLIGIMATKFNENLIKMTFSYNEMTLEILSAKWWPCCLNVMVDVSCHDFMSCHKPVSSWCNGGAGLCCFLPWCNGVCPCNCLTHHPPVRHICVSESLVQIMAYGLFSAKPLSKPVLVLMSIGLLGTIF